MAKLPNPKQLLKKTLFTGFGVVLPVFLTIYILDLMIRTTDRLLNFLPEGWRPPDAVLFPGHGIVFAVVISLIVGLFVRNLFGKWVMQWFNRAIDRIPVVASVYKLVRDIADAFLDGDQKKGFKQVVLVEWPRRESWMIAFVTAQTTGMLAVELKKKSAQNHVNLFIPTTPNPTSGFYFMAPEDELIPLAITVETAFKVIISGGTLSPDDVMSMAEAKK